MKLNAIAFPLFSVDWLIFLAVREVWFVLGLLCKSQKNELGRKKRRDLAETAVAAGEPYRSAEVVEVDGIPRTFPARKVQEKDRFEQLWPSLTMVHQRTDRGLN